MKTVIILLYALSPLSVLVIAAVAFWRGQRRITRTRSITSEAVKEMRRAADAACRGDRKAADVHMARFGELCELREEEWKL